MERALLAAKNHENQAIDPQNPSVEDASDDEDLDFEDNDLLEHGFFFLDDSPSEEDSDSDEDEELDEDELDGLINEANTLPPDMALKLKKEHEKKYSGQEN